MRRLALLAAVASVLGIVAVASAKTTVAPSCQVNKQAVRPSAMILACGDAAIQADHLHWQGWGQAKAVGTGRILTNTCKPSCAAGHFSKHQGSVTLTHRNRCSAHHFEYTSARYAYGAHHPAALSIPACP